MPTDTEEPKAVATMPKSTWPSDFAAKMQEADANEPAAKPVADASSAPAGDPPPVTPAAAEAKPPVIPPGDSAAATPDEKDDEKWPRSAQDWKASKKAAREREAALKKEIDEHKARVAEYEAKLKGAPSETQLKELDEIKKERDELSKRLQVVDVTKHPKFQEHFSRRTNDQIDLAKRIVGADNGAKIAELLQQPDSAWRQQQIDDLSLELTPTQISRLGGVINSLDQIEHERQAEIKDAEANYAQLQAQNAEKAKKRQADFQNLVESTIKAVSDAKEGVPAYQKREGDTSWNASVDERISKARAILTGEGMSTQQIIRASLDAAALPAVLKDNLSLRERITTLEAQVTSLTNASPKIEQGKVDTTQPRTEPPKVGSRPMDLTRAWTERFAKGMAGE